MALVAVMARRMGRVSPINSCHTLLVSDHGDTISESDNTTPTSNKTTLHFTLGSVYSESARCLLTRCHIKLVAVVYLHLIFVRSKVRLISVHPSDP